MRLKNKSASPPKRRGLTSRLRLAPLALGAVLAVTIAGCGSSGSSSSPQTNSAPPANTGSGSAQASAASCTTNLLTCKASNREDLLVAQAKKEGSLVVYLTYAGPAQAAIQDAFEKAYPFIKVQMTRSDDPTLTARVQQEVDAGKHGADVLVGSISDGSVLKESGSILPFWTPTLDNLPDQYVIKSDDGNALTVTTSLLPISFGYNTKLLDKAAVPKTLNDLLEPQLKGKMAIEASSSTSTVWIGGVLHDMGTDKGTAFLKKLAAQQAVIPQAVSGAALMGLIASGKIPASMSVYHDHALLYQQQGDPVEWVPLNTVVLNTEAAMIIKNAAHPAAAALFTDYLLSDTGQALLDKYQYTSATQKLPYKSWVPQSTYTTAESYSKAFDQWTALRNQLIKK